MSDADALRTCCECCEGVTSETPVELANRPGLSAIAYRAGTHARFKASMLAGLSASPALSELTTRRDDDLTVALVDGWATVLDVLTFYQERIANESYLKTAVERRSLLELARAIGYELGPGVAATTYLAFTADDSPGSPPEAIVPLGTRAQSIPGQDELPQSFETAEEIRARARWNALEPRRTETQFLHAPIRRLVFAGTGLSLAIGDRLLAVQGDEYEVFRVTEVTELIPAPASNDDPRTEVRVEPVDPNALALFPAYLGIPAALAPNPPGPLPFDDDPVATYVTNAVSWTATELAARLDRLGWTEAQLAAHLDARQRPSISTPLRIFAMRVQASFFGHNAPRWGSLPEDWRDEDKNEYAPYPEPWAEDQGADVIRDSQGDFHDVDPPHTTFFLDQAQKKILPGSRIVLEEAGTRLARAYTVLEVSETSRADYGLSGKATQVRVDTEQGLYRFEFRTAVAWGGSEELTLAEVTREDDVLGSSVLLETFALGLFPGRSVAVSGERADLPGVLTTEVRELAEVVHSMHEGATRLDFTEGLDHRYRRATVRISANLARATHGESRSEVLGSGDASAAFQRFALKHKPLTYVPAATASGGESSLEVRVNGVRWHESPDLYRLGPEDRSYVLRRDDDGTTRVLFGDGVHGARLPTGSENVTAAYRSGLGLGGHLAAGRISLLATRPLGVREVVNPVPATGAGDPESRDDARRNAPRTVLTLDRIVSLDDFEDFARTFSGVGKARADWLWDGRRRVVHLTITGADALPLTADAPLLGTLREAVDGLRDPFQPLVLSPAEALVFRLEAQIKVHPDHLQEVVFAAVRAELEERFGFAARDLARSVAASQVISAMQRVLGVVAVDLDVLAFDPAASGTPQAGRLPALPARLGPALVTGGERPIRGAQLLTLAKQGVSLEVMP
ncbi:MAG: putative baseplate assembly protein [Acidobacteria bacterium]|nr:putative baseplate assembly protein [Acidobacteriota bacterium]